MRRACFQWYLTGRAWALAAAACLLLAGAPDLTEAQSIELLADIGDGPEGSEPGSGLAIGSVQLFSADDGIHGTELWATDVENGSTWLVKDIAPGSASSGPYTFRAMNGVWYFRGQGLWRSDGSEEGTYNLAGFESYLADAVVFDDELYFAANGGGGTFLWKTDGSVAGTKLVAELNVYGEPLIVFGGELYFFGDKALWKTDGTPGGAVLVSDAVESSISSFVISGSELFFTADSQGTHERFLWKTDGTPEGTVLAFESEAPKLLAELNGRLLFQSGSGDQRHLWSSDGTPEGTFDLDAKYFAAGGEAILNDRLYFEGDEDAHGKEVWSTDGTVEGTRLVVDLEPGAGDSHPEDLTALKDAVVFTAMGAVWATDGTFEGTSKVVDLGSHRTFFVGMGAFASFSNWDEIYGTELWLTDGTTDGTHLVHDIHVNTMGSSGGLSIALPDRVYFEVWDRSIWESDGTSAGTKSAGDVDFYNRADALGSGRSFAAVGDRVFFAGADSEAGTELWSLAPGEAPARVADIRPGPESSGYWWVDNYSNYEGPIEFTAAGGLVYFFADDGVHGNELWRSDGTPAGTRLVRDILPSLNSVEVNDKMVAVGDEVFFSVLSQELWKSDGTEAGTVRVKALDFPWGGQMQAAGGTVYFQASEGDDSPHGFGLWSSDGTEAGTTMVADLSPEGSLAGSLTAAGDRLFFTVSTPEEGSELWVAEGRSARLVTEVVPGPDSSWPDRLTSVGDLVYFTANDGVHGRELWRTDGTAAGTYMLRDIGEPGASGPEGLANADGWLLFNADDGVSGRELWMSDGTTSGTFLLADLEPGPLDSSPLGFNFVDGEVVFFADVAPWGREPWSIHEWGGTHVLEVSRDGEGAGSVESEPAGISCGLDCIEVYNHGTPVLLSAEPELGSEFSGWSGSYDCSEGQLALAGPTTCIATFGPCSIDSEVRIDRVSINESKTISACNVLHVGPAVSVESGVDLILEAGNKVVFYGTFSLAEGSSLAIGLRQPD